MPTTSQFAPALPKFLSTLLLGRLALPATGLLGIDLLAGPLAGAAQLDDELRCLLLRHLAGRAAVRRAAALFHARFA